MSFNMSTATTFFAMEFNFGMSATGLNSCVVLNAGTIGAQHILQSLSGNSYGKEKLSRMETSFVGWAITTTNGDLHIYARMFCVHDIAFLIPPKKSRAIVKLRILHTCQRSPLIVSLACIIFKLMDYWEVFQEILLADWIANGNKLSATSLGLFKDHFASFMEAVCNFFHLGPYTIFLDVLRLSNTIISGSCALLALCPGAFCPDDLDIYTCTGPHTSELVNLLQSHGYYQLLGGPDRRRRNTRYQSKLVADVDFYYHIRDNRLIQVIYTTTPSPVAAIFDYHSTAVINYIAWYGVVCTHPRMTLEYRGVRLQNNTSAYAAFTKYYKRNFFIRTQKKEDQHAHSYSLTALKDTNSVMLLPSGNDNDIMKHMEDIYWMLPFRPTDSRINDHGIVITQVDEFGKYKGSQNVQCSWTG